VACKQSFQEGFETVWTVQSMDKIPVTMVLQDNFKSQHLSVTKFQTHMAYELKQAIA